MNRASSASSLALPDSNDNPKTTREGGTLRARDTSLNRSFLSASGGHAGLKSATLGDTVGPSRPRNRRPASTAALSDQELVNTSSTSTPSGSRAVSPIPTKYPSRSTSRNVAGNGVGGRLVVPETGGRRGSPQPQGLGGIWEGGWMGSWTALQGIANSVLGGETEDNGGMFGGLKPAAKTGHRRKTSTNPVWGPDGLPKKKADSIGVGTTSDTEAKVRARKMRGVLEGREEDLNVRKDTNGNYKRRTSSDEARSTPVEEDAMVYIHHVQPNDTLAGVILRYNCEPAVFRRANRFWPNDSIQTRKVVVIPVDACTIKGRPCDPPTAGSYVDLLAPTPSIEDPPTFNNGSTWPGTAKPIDTSAAPIENEDQPWVHVRWVLVDSSPYSKPVEIARMPRKTLGYFPPRRRKSQISVTASTPRASTDLSRFSHSPPSTTGTPPGRAAANVGSYFPSPAAIRPAGRPRRESVSEAADRLGWMRGPGGVGTLTGKNVRKPGPSQDGLNAWAKKHIPGLAIDSLPSVSLVGGETAHFGFDGEDGSMRSGVSSGMVGESGIITPSGGTGLGIENAVAAAAAIEGWVRRLAVKGPGTPRMIGKGGQGGEDLIELLDGAGSDDGRLGSSFDLNRVSSRLSGASGSMGGGSVGGGIGGISGIDDLLKGKGKKSD